MRIALTFLSIHIYMYIRFPMFHGVAHIDFLSLSLSLSRLAKEA